MTKQELRAVFKKRRSGLDRVEIAEKSGKIIRRLTDTAFYQESGTVMAYCSAFGEVDTMGLLACLWADGKSVYVPVCDMEKREAYPVRIKGMADLRPGAYGILEPKNCLPEAPDKLDMILVPGIAFDRRGGRIGFGMGYYDKLLRNTRAWKAALAYNFQIIDDVFSQPHDVPMDCIITESELIVCE